MEIPCWKINTNKIENNMPLLLQLS